MAEETIAKNGDEERLAIIAKPTPGDMNMLIPIGDDGHIYGGGGDLGDRCQRGIGDGHKPIEAELQDCAHSCGAVCVLPTV